MNAYVSTLVVHLRTPLYRTAYALMLSNIVTSGLGIVYWALAARLYSQRDVGVNAAMISAMLFLSGLAQLNLRAALNRFLPESGSRAGRFIAVSYVLAVAASVLVSVGALVVVGAVFGNSPWGEPAAVDIAVAFAVATAAWSIFNLQDGVFTGLRRPLWIPLENSSYALLKVVLLVGLAVALPAYGIFASWTIPAAIGVFLVTSLFFGRLVPQHEREAGDRRPAMTTHRIIRFVAADYLASLFALAYATLLPLLVVAHLGPQEAAPFYIVWAITTSLFLLPVSMGVSLTAESVATGADPIDEARRTLVHTMRLMLPIAAILVVGAPYILQVFGPAYASAATLLILLTLSIPGQSVVVIYVSVARVEGRGRDIIAVQGALAVLMLASTTILVRTNGMDGVGIAVLGSYSAVAVVLLATRLQGVWRGTRVRPVVPLTGASSAPETPR